MKLSPVMKVALYARVSTPDQSPELQLAASAPLRATLQNVAEPDHGGRDESTYALAAVGVAELARWLAG